MSRLTDFLSAFVADVGGRRAPSLPAAPNSSGAGRVRRPEGKGASPARAGTPWCFTCGRGAWASCLLDNVCDVRSR